MIIVVVDCETFYQRIETDKNDEIDETDKIDEIDATFSRFKWFVCEVFAKEVELTLESVRRCGDTLD